MRDEKKLAEQKARGEHAAQLLEDPMIIEFFDKAEQAIIQSWRESDPKDLEGQHLLRLALRCQENLRECFKQCVVTGKMAAHELIKP